MTNKDEESILKSSMESNVSVIEVASQLETEKDLVSESYSFSTNLPSPSTRDQSESRKESDLANQILSNLVKEVVGPLDRENKRDLIKKLKSQQGKL